ncbi:hypothetical protein [Sphingopyxis sp.]|uniref:hypothetical protein n=1 Tax=Sphingopyxis sp. TaxID=1908224 RepID=UPI001DB56DA3|nr:hypothetical protein [Sphingopyxis sp.]MBW8296012.1 hypothetical protein [Sphingopyxis sp.]
MKIPRSLQRGATDGDCDCLPRPDAPSGDAPPGAAPATTEPLTMYMLRYRDAWFGLEKRVSFEAADVAAALAMIALEPIGEWAELLVDGAVICRRGHEPGGAPDYWVVD